MEVRRVMGKRGGKQTQGKETHFVDVLLCLLRVEDCRFVAVIEEVPCCDKAIAS